MRGIFQSTGLCLLFELGRLQEACHRGLGKGCRGVKVNANGTFSTVVGGLNLPTSVEIVGDTAYVVTLTGDIWKVDGISGPPYGTN